MAGASQAPARDYGDVQKFGDMTRDIGVAMQNAQVRHEDRPSSWHGQGTEEPTASRIAQPGGFRRLFHLRSDHAIGAETRMMCNLTNTTTGGLQLAATGTNALPAPSAETAQQYAETSFIQQLLLIHNIIEFESDDGMDMIGHPLLGLRPDLQSLHIVANAQQAGGQSMASACTRKREDRVKFLVLMVLKPFWGTTILFLPRMFSNGGIVLVVSSILAIASTCILAMRLFVDCADEVMKRTSTSKVPSYGQVCEEAFGIAGRRVTNGALMLTQLCFCSCYFIFVPQTVRNILLTISDCRIYVSEMSLTIGMFLLLVPLALVRRMRYFATTNVMGNIFVWLGLAIVLLYIGSMPFTGPRPDSPMRLAKLDTYALALGCIIVLFEGIGTVLPMYDNTAPSLRPYFKTILTWSLFGTMTFWIVFGTVGYLALTDSAQTIVLFNMRSSKVPGGAAAAVIVQAMYCIAIFCSYPLQLYPVIGLVECYVRGSGQLNLKTKIKKNVIRIVLVAITALLAYMCSNQFDNFVALIGGLCGTPLVMIVPALTHLRLLPGNRLHMLHDVFIALTGFGCAAFSTYQSLRLWGSVVEPSTLCTGANT